MIKSDSVFQIGYISRTHGLRGEVAMCFTDDCFDTGTADYLVLEVDGIRVPFFWEDYKIKNRDTAILKFENVDSEERARELVGLMVYYPYDCVQIEDNDAESLSSFKILMGFWVSDASGKELGRVVSVNDSTTNILLTIKREDGHEVLVPFHNDFLLDFNLKKRTLHLQLPEGLLELNL